MKKGILISLFNFILFCNCKEQVKSAEKNSSFNIPLIKTINDSLVNVIQITSFIDSITNQSNIKLIDELVEEYDEKKNCTYLKGKKYYFKYFIEQLKSKNKVVYNTKFIDGKNEINFANYTTLKYENENFKGENYGFNNQNNLTNCKIIEVCKMKFLYSNVDFQCNGIGCGCRINLIYDLKNKKSFFIENYRFPYNNYFISDFNNDNIIDLMIISRGTNRKLKGLKIEENTYKITWFEYRNEQFKIRENYYNKEPASIELVSYTKYFDHGEADDCKYSLYYSNWK